MKQHTFAIVIAAIAFSPLYSPIASAQFSVQGGIGYNFGVPSDLIGKNSIQNFYNGNITASGIYGSYSSGVNFNIQASDNLNCCAMLDWGFGIDYQLGAKHTFTQTQIVGSGSAASIANADEGSVNMLSFTPRIGMHVNCGHTFIAYSYYGPIIGTDMKFNETITETGLGNISVENAKTTGKLSIGIMGAIGGRVPLTKKIGAYFEAGYNYMNFYPNARTVATFTENGINNISLLTKSEIETDYVKSISSTDNISPDQPTKVIIDPASYSGFRINAGIRYSF